MVGIQSTCWSLDCRARPQAASVFPLNSCHQAVANGSENGITKNAEILSASPTGLLYENGTSSC